MRTRRSPTRPPRNLAVLTLSLVAAAALAGCHASRSQPATPAQPGQPVVVDSSGGTVSGVGGASVTVPPGATAAPVTIQVTQDATGAPATPDGAKLSWPIFAITPHGTQFDAPVAVRVPFDPGAVGPDDRLIVLKADPGGTWTALESIARHDDAVEVSVTSFSLFAVAVVVPFFQPSPPTVAVQVDGSHGFEPPRRADRFPLWDQPIVWPFTVTVAGFVSCPAGTQPQLRGRIGAYTKPPAAYATQTIEITTGSWDLDPSGVTSIYLPSTLATNSYWLASMGPPQVAQASLCGYRMTAELWCMSPYGAGTLLAASPDGALDNICHDELTLGTGLGPDDVTATVGAQPTFDVGVMGGPNLVRFPRTNDQYTVQWQRSDDGGAAWRTVALGYEFEARDDPHFRPTFDDARIRHSSFTAPPAQLADDGSLIRAVVCYTPPGGVEACAFSRSARLAVTTDSAPSFVAQPADALVPAGSTATFTVAVAGAPTPTLRWQSLSPGAAAWADIAGATGASYTTPAVALADNGSQVRAVATNPLGTAASAPAMLAVSTAPVAPAIATQPASVTVDAGNTATFAVVATGTAPLSYQWSKDGVPLGGAAAAVLTLPAASPADAGSYAVAVSNAAGSVASAAATLTVNPIPVAVAPIITTQPLGLSVPLGSAATLAVAATGTAPLAYQWSKDGTPIAGATAAVYALAAVAAGDAGSYTVTVSNGVSPPATSVPATLSVITTPLIAAQPVSVTVTVGQAATFTASATGAAPLSYQWLRNGVAVVGATGPSTTTPATVAADGGAVFSVVVSNPAGSVVSSGAVLTVFVPPPPTLTSVTPGSGPTGGGTALVLAGTGFQSGATVTVGGAAATGVTWVSATSLTAVTPAGAAGAANVVVTNPDGQSATATAAFTYVAPTLAVTSVLPANASAGNAPSTTTVQATFSAPLDCATATAARFQVLEGAVTVPGAVGCAGSTLTFQPTPALPSATGLHGHLDGAIGGLAGGTLGAAYDWTFGMGPWTRQLGTTAFDQANAVATDPAGDVFVVGSTQGGLDGNTLGGLYDFFATKYSPAGAKLWTRQLGGATGEITLGLGAAADAAGNLYVVGETFAALDGNVNAGASDAFIVKYDPAGTKLWSKLLGTANGDAAAAAAVDASGNLFVVGWTGGNLDGNVSAGLDDLFVAKLDGAGTKLWTRQLGSIEYDQAKPWPWTAPGTSTSRARPSAASTATRRRVRPRTPTASW